MDALRFQRVQVTGSFDTDREYLLANQARDGVSGYRILTPLRLNRSDTAVLVARGWVAAHGDRRELPPLEPAPSGEQTITGIATDGPSVGYRMGSAYVGDGAWPRRVTYLDFDAMKEALPYRLVSLVIEPNIARDERVARLMGGVTPTRHIGYAVQWFGLAAALIVIYIVVNLRRENAHGG
jgi:surfeit locus 1 family protein